MDGSSGSTQIDVIGGQPSASSSNTSALGSAATGAAAGSAFGPWGAVAGGAIGLVGGILGNASSAKQSAEQMQFQERMASTQHQREVIDLRAAGLNPILSATGGPGAAAPSGSMAPQADVLSPALSSALKTQQVMNETSTQQQNVKNLEAQEKNTIQATDESSAREQAALAQARKTKIEGSNAFILGQQMTNDLRISNARQGGDLDAAKLHSSDSWGDYGRRIQRVLDVLGPIFGSAKGAVGAINSLRKPINPAEP